MKHLVNMGLGRGRVIKEHGLARIEGLTSEHGQRWTYYAWAQWMKIVSDDHLLPMTAEPDNIRVVVAGGPGKHSLVVPSWGMTRSVTLPVEG